MLSGWRLTKIQATTRPENVWPEVCTKTGKAVQNREKQEWASEKPKLDNARRFRSIYIIDPEDGESKETIKKCEEKVGNSDGCGHEGTKKHCSPQETEARSCESNKIPKTKHACIVEAHESTRQRLESSPPKDLEENHIAGKKYNSMTHFNLVHKFIPVPQEMKIPDGKAAVDKEWKKLEAIPAWQLERVKSKKAVILEAQRDKKKVHFATLMDICHLKNAELEPNFQKYKGRVAFRGDTVEDDSRGLCSLY